jgi:hypothetical protein
MASGPIGVGRVDRAPRDCITISRRYTRALTTSLSATEHLAVEANRTSRRSLTVGENFTGG